MEKKSLDACNRSATLYGSYDAGTVDGCSNQSIGGGW